MIRTIHWAAASVILAGVLAGCGESIMRAREMANRAKCANNLRQIALAAIQYADQHGGSDRIFAPDLRTLVSNSTVDINLFVCPSSNTAVPATILQGSREEQAEWVQANADYTYVGAGLPGWDHAESVIFHDKLVNHTQGMNLAYGDGHVIWQAAADARSILDEQAAR